jgi:HAD superfamily hydrolase (TIGR01509 family)
MTMTNLRGVILDIDGTLVDSNDAHALAWVEALAKHEHHIPFERIRPLIGMGADKLLPALIGVSKDSPEGYQIARLREEIFANRYILWVQSLPYARELLLRLKSDGLKLAIATSAQESEVMSLLRIANVEDLIDNGKAAEPGQESKPAPDVVQGALWGLALPPEQVIMVGDTPYDIEAAHRAGIPAIAFRSGGWEDSHLTGAAAIYDDPADLLANYGASLLSTSSVRAAGSPVP